MAYGFNHEGYDLSGYDQDLVKQAQGGGSWGEEDQARYDNLVKAKQKAQGHKNDIPKPSPNDEDGLVYKGGTPGFYDEGGPGRGKHIDGKPDKGATDMMYRGKPGGGGRPGSQKIGEVRAQVEPNRGSSGKPTNAIDNTVTGQNDAAPSNMDVRIRNDQEQNVNQDNDINTSVTGNNNTVITEQDNSIRNYGGDNRSFVYNGGGDGNKYEDTPMSAATMSGFYDVDDSPAAQARFNDLYTTMNRDNQKRYAGEAMKTFAKYGNIDARSYTDQSMENALNRGVQYSFDRADRQTGHVFGDIWNDNYITEEWKMPSAPAKIESKAGEIADKAKKDIEDI